MSACCGTKTYEEGATYTLTFIIGCIQLGLFIKPGKACEATIIFKLS